MIYGRSERKSRRRLSARKSHSARAVLTFNATPLVDVIFILTIFFMLISRFSSEELVPMDLPRPEQSQAKVVKMPDRVVINCRLADPARRGVLRSSRVDYSLGPNRPEPLGSIAARLVTMKRESPEMKVVVRADRRLPYGAVRIVMQVLAENRIAMLNVVAHVAEE